MFQVIRGCPGRPLFVASFLLSALLPCSFDSFPQDSSPRNVARFASFDEAKITLDLYATSGLSGSAIASGQEWDNWVQAQDAGIRSRIDRGVEDSISNFVLYGTSFTTLARLSGSAEALDSDGAISASARGRIHALASALQSPQRGERVEFIREFFARRKILRKQWESFLTANLARFAQEQQAYRKKLAEAEESGDASEMMSVRGTLYEQRGLSADTSLLPNFAIEETLRAMVNKGVLKPGSMRRIAIVGPGLDFTDKRDGYDFYPLQTLQPFAVLESVHRLRLAGAGPVQVVALDLNAAVNAHVAQLSARGRAGHPYVIQLPCDTQAKWNDAALAYWKQFGLILGTQVRPLPVPEALPSVEARAVAIRPQYSAAITPVDLNIVAQTIDLPPGEGFDLVVATNILVYYDLFQQALAMNNIARMMNPGGIFVANNALPAAHDPRLKYLGRKNVAFAQDGSYGDDVVVYQRQ